MALSTQEQILIEQRVMNSAKSSGVAYLLALFLGGLGAHRLYLGHTGSGITMLILFIVGLLTSVIGVGLILLLIVSVWALVDLFLIPGMIEKQKTATRLRLANELTVLGLPA